MNVLYFGICRERVGRASEILDLPEGSTIDDLWRELSQRYSGLDECRSITRVAVNMEYALESGVIPPDAEVALIPPVAGG